MSSPSPKSSVPASLEIIVKFLVFLLLIELIRFSGIPQTPNPPNRTVAPSCRSCSASLQLLKILLEEEESVAKDETVALRKTSEETPPKADRRIVLQKIN